MHYVLLIKVHLDANLEKFTTALAAGWMFSIQQEVLLCKATCFYDVQESVLLCWSEQLCDHRRLHGG